MTKTARRFLAAGITAAFTAICVALALLVPNWFFSFYPNLSRAMQRPLAAISAPFPFALWELLLALAILWGIVSLILAIFRRKKLQWLAGLVCGLTFAVGAFTCLWGINHFGPSIADTLDLPVGEHTKEELIEATVYYLKMANATSTEVARNDDGTIALPSFIELARQASAGYEILAQDIPTFRGSLRPVKPVTAWPIMSRFGLTGIFICFTGESSVNPNTYPASMPYTMCHELAHRLAVAPENEANFAAYLSSRINPDPNFRYSAYYSAFIYCYNALYAVSPKTAQSLWQYASNGLIADCGAAHTHYEKYEGAVQDAAQKVNDAYLKAFQETSGVQSYGEVADLLISLYFFEKGA